MDSGPLVAPFAARVVLPIAGLVGLVHCAAAAFGEGYWFDEVYMLAIGHYHLDWGSADQPPLAPALAAVMDAIAPGSLVALRCPPRWLPRPPSLSRALSRANSDVTAAHGV